MQDGERKARNRESFLEGLAAELTTAAYPVALQHGTDESWAELELGLWKVLSETLKKQAHTLRPRRKARTNPALRADEPVQARV